MQFDGHKKQEVVKQDTSGTTIVEGIAENKAAKKERDERLTRSKKTGSSHAHLKKEGLHKREGLQAIEPESLW